MSARGGTIANGIGLLAGAVTRYPVVTVMLVLAGTAAAFAWTAAAWRAGEFGINTDTANMIAEDLPWRQDFIGYRDSFPERDRNLVAVVDAASGDEAVRFAERLAAALRAEAGLFPSVFYARGEDFFERNGLLFLSLDELERLEDRLATAQPFLGRLAAGVSGARILEVLEESLAPDTELPAALAAELDVIFARLAGTFAAAAAGDPVPVAWRELMGLGAEPERRQIVLIRPSLDFSRVRPAREAIERIREIADSLRADGAAGVSLRLTGTLAMEHEELSSVTESASAAGIAALVMVTIVLLWALRSVVLLFVALATLLSGLMLTVAFAALTVGHLNLLSVAFAVLYVGLGVDFILHLTLRLRELRRSGVPVAPALVETARGVGTSLVICAVTTAVGFFAFVPTDFVGISELGVISGGGMIISLVVSLTLLPALLRLFPGRAPAPPGAVRQRRLPRWRGLPAAPVCVAAAVVAAVAAFQLPGLRFDANPIHLRDPGAESIRTLEDLADANEAPLFSLVAVVDDESAAAAAAARLGALDDVVAEVATLSSYVPAEQDEKLFVIEDLGIRLGATLRALERRPAANGMAATVENLVAGLREQASLSAAQAEFLAAANRWLERSPDAPPAGSGSRDAAELDRAIVGDLMEQIDSLERGLNARAFSRDELPESLTSRWRNPAGQEIVEVVPSENLNDNAAARRFVDAVRGVVPNATGLPVVYEEAAATVTRAFSFALAYAFAAVALLLLVFLRSVRDASLVLVPIAFAALVTAAASVLLDLPLNFANIIALPLLIGVGVDSGIHMVHRMRTEPPRDGDPLHTSTSRAVLASALTTVASFGNLAFSTHLGMASMGQLLTLGMVVSVIAILILLPALMRLSRVA